MTDPMIGVSGWAGAGKDTVADTLTFFFEFKKMAFADPLREMAMAIDPIVAIELTKDTVERENGHPWDFIRYSDALARYGYNEAKLMFGGEIRRFLQKLGTEAVRDVLGGDTWTKLAMERAWAHMFHHGEGEGVVHGVSIADTRFRNEADVIVSDGKGVVIRVNRPGVGPASDHISEHDLDDWNFDWIIENDGTEEDLAVKVIDMMDQLFGWKPAEGTW